LASIKIELLHSRFYPSDRTKKEDRIRQEFGEDRTARTSTPMILVATQVIEVGLNITCDALHTEMAPAAALVQRAGRCARFANEQGDVFIYDVPVVEQTGAPDYAPYLDEGQRAVCERTYDVIRTVLPKDGKVLNYHAELEIVDTAHAPFDEALLEQLRANRHTLRKVVESVLERPDRSAARELIRDIDNRTVIIHPNPTPETVPNPYRLESIGIRRNALLRWYTGVQEHAWNLNLDWIAAIAITEEQHGGAGGEDAEQGRRLTTNWQYLRPAEDKAAIRAACNDLASFGLTVTLNPALVQYDSLLGFRAEPGNEPAIESRPASSCPREHDTGPIEHETYAEHIAGLYRVYVRMLRSRTAATRVRLEQRHGLEPETLDRAIRLMFAVHDLGKLDQTWQQWAHAWQKKVSELRNDPSLVFTADYMAAHTNYDSRNNKEREAQSTITPKRPNHAAESARAGRALVQAVARSNDSLYTALMSAIICHHSPTLRIEHGPFVPTGQAAQHAFSAAMKEVGLFDDASLRASGAKVAWAGFQAQAGLSEDIIDMRRVDDIVLYLFLVRILRLADQGSQEKG
jgi:CRISPR-associated endonuclease/helicase Cas3